MNYAILAILLCAFPALLHAACYVKTMEEGMTECQDAEDGTWHPIGSTWRNSQCYDCDCSGCCQAFSTPRSFPDDCVSVFDSEACEFKVHKKGDPSTLCEIYVAVGK